MKLLVLTQAIDRNDTVMGFFHRWVAEFGKQFEKVTVVALKKGDYDLPANVQVLSLGKESGRSRLKYVANFYRYIWRERGEYDAVFVHMNQEYVILGGIIWKLLGKRVSMWRNHHAGNLLTDLAAAFCGSVFCTSRYSYTAKYKKTVLMPVGIDTSWFYPSDDAKREPGSILFLGRIAPVKRPDLLISALGDLARAGKEFTATFIGDPLPKDREYAESLRVAAREEGIAERVVFKGGIPNDRTREAYRAHDVFVNLSSSGMYDKTIFEAMACGSLVLASNENLRGFVDDMFIFKEGDRKELGEKLARLLALPKDVREKMAADLGSVVREEHSLERLARKVSEVLVLR